MQRLQIAQGSQNAQDGNGKQNERMEEVEIRDLVNGIENLHTVPVIKLSDRKVMRQPEQQERQMQEMEQQMNRRSTPNKRQNNNGVSVPVSVPFAAQFKEPRRKITAKRKEKEEKKEIEGNIEKEMKARNPNYKKLELKESDDLTELTNKFLERNGFPVLGRDLEETKDFAINRITVEFKTQRNLPEDKSKWDPKFVFSGLHTKPTDAVAEIDGFYDVYQTLKKDLATSEIILMGDLNAGCSYVPQYKWPEIRIRTDKTYKWYISDSTDTTVSEKQCPYDRFISKGVSQTIRSQVYRYDLEFKISREMAKKVSDHWPIEMYIFN